MVALFDISSIEISLNMAAGAATDNDASKSICVKKIKIEFYIYSWITYPWVSNTYNINIKIKEQ